MNQKTENFVGLRTAALISVVCLAVAALAYFVRQGILLVLVWIGTALAAYGIWLIVEAKRTYKWTKGQGVIRQVKITKVHDFTQDETMFRIAVKFAFREGQQEIIGEKIRFSSRDEQFLKESEGQSFAERFQPGQSVPIYLDPRRPGVAILEPGVSEKVIRHYYGIATSGLLVIVVSCALLWWTRSL